MKTKFNIEIPFSPGFYESVLYNYDMDAEESRMFLENKKDEPHPGVELSEDDVVFNFEAYKNAAAEAFIKAWNKNKLPFIKAFDVNSIRIISPASYNYTTDRIFVDVRFEDNWLSVMSEFILNNRDYMIDRISEWVSHDGFVSFMDSDINKWCANLMKLDERYISCMIEYMFDKESDCTKEDLYEDTLEDIYMEEFYSLSGEVLDKIDDYKENHPGWDMTGQLELF